jgi:hypothetical protein
MFNFKPKNYEDIKRKEPHQTNEKEQRFSVTTKKQKDKRDPVQLLLFFN